ncbi:hypothetical protein [Achromobacter marplatensis]|uniref:hypothetical protein n=1 Tax=Achromobacter marplatensis TaxID=470868 RepID=UPI003C707338
MTSHLTGHDFLLNWARSENSGPSVGNMAPHFHESEPRPVNEYHAQKVREMYQKLPWHEQMILQAEYSNRQRLFGDASAKERRPAAIRWIGQITGVWLNDTQYKLYLGLFRNEVERRLA